MAPSLAPGRRGVKQAKQRSPRRACQTPDFETARMYRGPAHARDDSRIFAEATLELG